MGNGKGVQSYVAFSDGGEKGASVPETPTKQFGRKWTTACMVIPWILFIICLLLLGLVSCWGWEQHRQLQEKILQQELKTTNFPTYEGVNTANSDNVLKEVEDDDLDLYDDDDVEDNTDIEEIENEIDEALGEETEEEEEEDFEEQTEEEAEEEEKEEEEAENELEETEEEMEEEIGDEAVEEAEYAKEQAEEAEEEEEEEVEEEAEEDEEEAEEEAEEEEEEEAEDDYTDISSTSNNPLDETTDVTSENENKFEEADYMINTENIVDLDDLPEIDFTEMTDGESASAGNDDNFDDFMGIDAVPNFSTELENDFETLEDNMENISTDTNTVV